MKNLVPLCASLVAFAAVLSCGSSEVSMRTPIIFATFAGDAGTLSNVLAMAESIRAFGGRYKKAAVCAYMPAELSESEAGTVGRLTRLGVEVRSSDVPEEASWYFLAGKVFAAARAEAEAAGTSGILAWLDGDTIVLREPAEFLLAEGVGLGYRPVMHKNVGLLYAEPLDEFWGRAFKLLSVPDDLLFPMVTPADGDTIKPYFNAGCMIIRPERGLMARWVECFKTLYADSLIAEMCRAEVKKRIFMHQVALTGAILTHLDRNEMIELSPRINYPIFFDEVFGAKRVFDDITNVVTIRHESYFSKPAPDWDKRLKGPADRIAWIKEHLSAQTAND
jgi:hypothetical protein